MIGITLTTDQIRNAPAHSGEGDHAVQRMETT